ncbi:lipoyl(octanoyl) transferase LipB [Candidatus Bipolaricaulota bacterium]|nr:lipoyl(octanoyl) transferase LipB [Candidatus Bipolaricaulota bacterium]
MGRIGYDEGLAAQTAIHRRCLEASWADTFLSLEHDPVITLGRSSSASHILASPAQLMDLGIITRIADRGGNVTYHGPGQLVVYAIVDLRHHGKNVRGFITCLEHAMLRVLAPMGIDAHRNPERPGIWVDDRKIASIGVAIRHWVTRHGLALNIAVDPEHFRTIRPCGLEVETVSITDLIAAPPPIEWLASQLIGEIADRLDLKLTVRTAADLKEAIA